MRRAVPATRPRPGRPSPRVGILLLAVGVWAAGCGGSPDGSQSPGGVEGANLDNSGLMLPPDFKPVDLPVEKRKEIFREAHLVRARAVQEANQKLPMDEAHLPIGDTAAFDKRVADHKAIIDEILEKNLAALADRHDITSADLAKIEEEASRLRWVPPPDPEPEKPSESGTAPG